MQITFVPAGLNAGRFSGHLEVQGPESYLPAVEVLHLGKPIGEVDVSEIANRPQTWLMSVAIPAELLSDGVQTFVIRETGLDQTLGSFTIIAGEALEDDLRAEIGLLRAELDLLKSAFRREMRRRDG